MKRLSISLALILTLSACAEMGAEYRPLIDYRMSPQLGAHYDKDLSECQGYAKQRGDAATGAAIGVVLGAVLGAALSGGMSSHYRNDTIAYGAGLGGTYGAANATETQQSIVKRCLAGRGYAVLN